MMGSRRARQRERWAQQETERRRTAYQASLTQWRRRDDELRALLTAATTAQPAPDGDWSGWLHLARGETVYWTGSDTGLIEGAYVLRLRPPHYRELSRADEPPAGPPIDTGQVAVTDRRVVYIGRMVREWPYAKLIGMSHTVDGETWLLATSGQKVAGVAPPSASQFRLHLALALADSAGERDAFLAELAEQVQRHGRAEPEPPARATAGEAPHPVRWGRHGRLLTAAAAASAVLVSLLAIGIALGGSDQRPDSFSAATGPPAVPSPPPESPLSTGSPPASRGEPIRQAVAPQQQPPPPPTASPAPATPSPTEDALDPRFSDCDEANENGFGPYVRDEDPEYWWYPDRNEDGVVCRP